MIESLLTKALTKYSLEVPFRRYRRQQCSDPWHRMHAHIGVTPPISESSLKIHYATTVHKVYKAVARYFIEGPKLLDIICNAEKMRVLA